MVNLHEPHENFNPDVLLFPAGGKRFTSNEEADAEWHEHLARHRQRFHN
jgi:hypothetical protein